jgi:hypothetical protein
MQYTLYHHSDEPGETIEYVLNAYETLPDWDSLVDGERDVLLDELLEDDYLGRLIVMREAAYSQSESVDQDLAAAFVIEREMFRAAEWLRSTSHVYVAGRIAQLLDLEDPAPGDVLPEVGNGGGERA